MPHKCVIFVQNSSKWKFSYSHYIYLQGEIYWRTENTTEAPMNAPPMQDSSATQNMLYLWVSDYIFATIAYVAQKHNFLVYNLTAKDVSRVS